MNYNILIVDDSKLARMAVNKALNALRPEWPRIEAATVDEAMRAIRDAAPDIALLDINMPGRNGLEFAAELRRVKPDMPVAIISANRQQEILKRAEAVGATFLAKPLSEDALAEFLQAAEKVLSKVRQ